MHVCDYYDTFSIHKLLKKAIGIDWGNMRVHNPPSPHLYCMNSNTSNSRKGALA